MPKKQVKTKKASNQKVASQEPTLLNNHLEEEIILNSLISPTINTNKTLFKSSSQDVIPMKDKDNLNSEEQKGTSMKKISTKLNNKDEEQIPEKPKKVSNKSKSGNSSKKIQSSEPIMILESNNDGKDPETVEKSNVREKFNSKWTDKKSSYYRPYAQKSEQGEEYLNCTWCDAPLKINSLYGKEGHLKTPLHQQRQKEYTKKIDHEDVEEESLDITDDKKLKKKKSFEWALCWLLVKLHLAYSNVSLSWH